MMRANLLLLLDVTLYFIFPLFLWDFGRSYFGDYFTMIFSTVPGIFYTLYRFKMTEHFNFTGIFIIFNLVSGTVVDLLSMSALQLLWNNVFTSLAIAMLYLISCLLKKPIPLFLTLDIMVLKGYDGAMTKKFFYEKKPLILFHALTIMYCLGECIYALLMTKWISLYGVEAFHFEILLDNTLNVVMTGISILSFIYMDNLINNIVSVKSMMGTKHVRKIFLSSATHWYRDSLEKSYFYFCNLKR
jgi:hypothetical protein